MDETKEEIKATTDTGEGDKPKTTPLIDIANQAAERMENANKETARLQEVQAERDQRVALGGSTEAGQTVEKKEDTPEEYTEKVMSGSLNKEDD